MELSMNFSVEKYLINIKKYKIMRAAILESQKNLKIRDIKNPDYVPDGYVKIRVKSVGICGSDVHYYSSGRIGDFILKSPMILGHETGGIAESDGDNIKRGDVVAIEPGIPCGKCIYCRSGRYNLCSDIKFFATPPVDGSMREYIVHPEGFVYNAKGLSTSEASLAEPMSVGVYAVRKSLIGPGDSVLITGSGSVGILTAFVAESSGASVTLSDVDPKKMDYASKCGFNAYLNDKIRDKFDAVFECSGFASEFALDHVKRGGDIFLIGMGNEDGLNNLKITSNEITVHGIFRYRNTFETAISIIKKYRERMKPLTEKHIGLEQLPDYLENGEYAKYIKTIVDL